jgi:hypothetical protein
MSACKVSAAARLRAADSLAAGDWCTRFKISPANGIPSCSSRSTVHRRDEGLHVAEQLAADDLGDGAGHHPEAGVEHLEPGAAA